MHRGSLMRVSRKQGPDVWQFRWSERELNGRRVYRKKVLGSVGRYADEAAARCAVIVFLAEINSEKVQMSSRSLTVAQLCDHFEQRELAKDNAWRSHVLLRSVGTEFKVMQELLRHSSLRSTLDIYTQAITPAKHAAQAAVLSLVFSPETNGTQSSGSGEAAV
jgi:hypothetical protein